MNRAEYLCQQRLHALRGNDLPQSRLNPDLVREIRASPETHRAIAARLRVHYRTVEKVRHYETWVHVL